MNRRLLRDILAFFCLAVGFSLWAQSKETAEIIIASNPSGAFVYLPDQDANKSIGITPIKLALKPGTHQVVLSLAGYKKESVQIEVGNPPKNKTYEYKLTKSEDGVLRVLLSAESMMDSFGRAEEADVYLDGELKGKTPLIIDPLPPGPYTLQVKKSGFLQHEQVVSISRGRFVTVEAKLVAGFLAAMLAKPSPPIYLATGSSCCSQALRKGGEALRGVWGAAKSNVLLAVGEGGAIERSETSGSSWNSISSPTTKDLHAIWGSGSTTIAVGEEGTILRSTDGGVSWMVQASGVTEALHSIWGADLKNIYIVGDNGLILFSFDEGVTWTTQESLAAESLFGVYGRSSKEVYAVGEHGKILRKAGGAWTSVPSGASKDLYSVSDTPAGALLVAGQDGTILRSTDGSSWHMQRSLGAVSLYSISRTAKALYAVGDVVLHSVDDGLSWKEISSSMRASSSWMASGSLVVVGR
jgi:photosystem II stability/assembly factor-like uncharacterized protein